MKAKGGGLRLPVALADLIASASLGAATAMVCGACILDGAVYRLAVEIVLTDRWIDEVMAVFAVPETAAVRFCGLEGLRLMLGGLRDSVTAWRIIIAVVEIFDRADTPVTASITLHRAWAVLSLVSC